MGDIQRTELGVTVLEDLAHVVALANDFAINVVSTNGTVVLLDMKADIEGSGGFVIGSVVWSNSEESFVFVPAEQD